ncbi:MAG TPA: hypothetical protein VN725_06770 [Rhodanobacteraceae bacterium]|nr:hypothetical protein [Rhodanobacteraceae bacterium]
MTFHPRTTTAKSLFVRKERKECEEKQNSFFFSLRPSRAEVLAVDGNAR